MASNGSYKSQDGQGSFGLPTVIGGGPFRFEAYYMGAAISVDRGDTDDVVI